MIRNVRDKSTARRRNEDSILRELDRFAKHKKKPGQALLDKRDALEIEIASLEKVLDGLQTDEYRRHSDMIKERSRLEILATLSSSDAATTIATIDHKNNESSSGDSANDEDDVVDVTPAAAAAIQTIVSKGWCIECSTPSNHSCHKQCKKCVCSLCCGQRELENVWWCNACFSTQTVANQQLIRDGNYDSDDDEEDN